jgi:phosphopentomutase
MMGIKTTKPFKTFTDHGFPNELIEKLEKQIGSKLIGNKAASGTEIIKELGLQQIKENSLIIYTSSDSVLQLAAHESHYGLDNLYKACEIAREICMEDKYKVARIIARPYIGDNPNNFKRNEKLKTTPK